MTTKSEVPTTTTMHLQIVGAVTGKCPALQVETVNQASAIYRRFIESNGLGGSEAGTAWLLRNGKRVGHVSYNGRVFEGGPKDWKPGIRPIFDPFAE